MNNQVTELLKDIKDDQGQIDQKLASKRSEIEEQDRAIRELQAARADPRQHC
jgi:lipopolysaccharide biosynthesis regulator YciM